MKRKQKSELEKIASAIDFSVKFTVVCMAAGFLGLLVAVPLLVVWLFK